MDNKKTSISQLIEMAKAVTMTAAESEEQRRSFVYGNTAFENRRITREMVDRQAQELGADHEERHRRAV